MNTFVSRPSLIKSRRRIPHCMLRAGAVPLDTVCAEVSTEVLAVVEADWLSRRLESRTSTPVIVLKSHRRGHATYPRPSPTRLPARPALSRTPRSKPPTNARGPAAVPGSEVGLLTAGTIWSEVAEGTVRPLCVESVLVFEDWRGRSPCGRGRCFVEPLSASPSVYAPSSLSSSILLGSSGFQTRRAVRPANPPLRNRVRVPELVRVLFAPSAPRPRITTSIRSSSEAVSHVSARVRDRLTAPKGKWSTIWCGRCGRWSDSRRPWLGDDSEPEPP